jgi:site-specific DNA recombinase
VNKDSNQNAGRAFGYVRVSKDPDREKLSPEIQRQNIRRYCAKERLELVDIYEDVDVPSAKIDSSGTWKDMVGQVGKDDLIITNDSTRLGRDYYDTLTRVRQLHKAQAEVVSLAGKIDMDRATGKLQFNMLVTIAQFQNDMLSESLKAMHARKAELGEWKGGGVTALGYDFTPGEKQLRVNEAEAAVVREIYQLRDNGWSIQSIAREMEKRGIPGKRTRMNYTSVRMILSKRTYVAEREYQNQILPMGHEPIIERDLWERVQARGRATSKQEPAPRYLLSGMLRCGDCGEKMTHRGGWKKDGSPRSFYVCRAAIQFRDRRAITIENHFAEAVILEAFFGRLNEKKIEAAKGRARKRQPRRETRKGDVERRLAKIDRSIEKLFRDRYEAEEPLLSGEQFRVKNAELLERRTALLEELQDLADQDELDNVVYLERAQAFKVSWEGLSLDERREALRLLIDHIVVLPVKQGSRNEKRLEIKWR